MNIARNISLDAYTTLKLGGPAAFFVSATTERDIEQAIAFANARSLPWLILGGGSNVLVSDEGFSGVVIHMKTRGITHAPAGDDVLVSAAAGEDWDAFVATCISNGMCGIENLSGIPGTVGATPIQNVGAYGVEIRDVLESVDVYDTDTGNRKTLSGDMCGFGYRDSMFKHEEGKRFIVLSVCYRLSRTNTPRLEYKDLSEYFASWKRTPTAHDIRRAVLDIRSRKFPPLSEVGTAGSFFKIPIVSAKTAQLLVTRYPGLPVYPFDDGRAKISISWLLDCVYKLRGTQRGVVGVSDQHALALVHYGGGSATDMRAFANMICDRVRADIGIDIEPEVTFV